MSDPAVLGGEAAVMVPALQTIAVSRLCKTCKHGKRPLTGSWFAAICERPGLPVNLVTGERRFPCVIARGYNELCGVMGLFHERK